MADSPGIPLPPTDVATDDVDLFADDALAEPYGHLRRLRDLGPAVWLSTHGCYVLARYEEARAALADADAFCSGRGVGFNDVVNEVARGTTLMSDGDEHRRQRSIIGQPLTPRRLAELRPVAADLAAGLVDGLLERGRFDAVRDLAEVIPATWVPDLLGWPEEGRPHLVAWGSATFDGLGPLNDRTVAAAEGTLAMSAFAAEVARRDDLPPDSMAAGVLAAADRGEVERDRCPLLMVDYLAPSLDTTISAIGNAMWLFATHPDQWDRLRADPGLARRALDEVLRLESPISCFSRITTRSVDVGGARCPPTPG